ncbi:hypothetical protein BJY01DRAFT_261865 [Aspergillus pseudoustus]|uniref:Zn(2)-C6 fungal-type domain-containing protein n=1 Tax=Aspergillus pseudoustus TaxID=1810923 RepID=A0ABR4IJ97_9EURO
MSPTVQHKACDICHNKKKKCLTDPGSLACTRCHKFSLVCTTSRDQLRAGRPPKQVVLGNHSLGVWDYTAAMRRKASEKLPDQSHSVPETGSLRDQELCCKPLQYLSYSPVTLSEENFYLLSDIYMLGPTFAKDFRRALQYCHFHSPEMLEEMYLALGSCLSWARFGLLTADQIDISSGAAAVNKLRNINIQTACDALGCLMLGQALAAFNSLILSTGTIAILRFSLSLFRPWYPDVARVRFLEPITIAPIFWDTIWCLLHREVPVIRPILSCNGVIDRVAGLCTSLLPTLYDLCVFSLAQENGQECGNTLDEIEQEVRGWTPDESSLSKYTVLEMLSITTQATMYREAALLLIHWHRKPLTGCDAVATALANEILAAKARFFAIAGPSAKLQHSVLPTFLALLQVSRPEEEDAWEISTLLRTRPACADGLVAFHNYVWEQRRLGFSGSLFDLIENGPDFLCVP